MPPRPLLPAALLAALAFGPAVRAQTPATPPADEARTAYELGVSHLDAGRYQEAALALERSYGLRAVPVALYNLALAYRGLGRYREAVRHFDRYLQDPGAATPERLTAIRAEREELLRALVHVSLSVTPAAATLQVDGRAPVPSPETLELDPGPHVLEWRAPAHVARRESFTATPGARPSFTVALEPIRVGRLQVEASYPSVEIVIDGARAGVGRVDRELSVGEHAVTLRAPDYREVLRRVTVQPGATVRVVVTMERERLPRWVIPTVVGAGVVVVGAVVAGVLVASQPDVPPLVNGTWGTFRE